MDRSARLARFALPALLLAASASLAQSALPSFEERTGWPLPQSGIYYDPAQAGIGLSFDVGLDGTVMAGLGAYDAEGRSTFYTLQGRISRDEAGVRDGALLGVLRSPVYLSRAIGCPQCPGPQQETLPVPELGTAEVRFLEPRRLELRVAGGTWRMQRMVLNEDPWQWTEGRFLMALADRDGHRFLAGVAAPAAESAPQLRGVVAACPSSIPQGEVRRLTCEGDCAAFDTWAGVGPDRARVLVWRNRDSDTVQLGRFREADGALEAVPGRAPYTLAANALTVASLPATPACGEAPGTLKLFRDPAPFVFPRGTFTGYRDLFSARAGIWWNPDRAGSGIVMDTGERTLNLQTVFGFVGLFDFDERGQASFSSLQGEVLGFPQFPGLMPYGLYSPVYTHRDGQRLGGPWRAPVTIQNPRQVRLHFASSGDPGTPLTRSGGFDAPTAPLERLERFPLDRDPMDEVVGRFLLRWAPPVDAIPAPPAVLAEVTIEPLSGAEAAAPLFAGSRAYRVRCARNCSGFDAWRRSAQGAERELVLWYERYFDAPAPGQQRFDTSLPTLALLTPTAQGFVREGDARSWRVDALPRDRYRTRFATRDPNGDLNLFRDPPRVFAD